MLAFLLISASGVNWYGRRVGVAVGGSRRLNALSTVITSSLLSPWALYHSYHVVREPKQSFSQTVNMKCNFRNVCSPPCPPSSLCCSWHSCSGLVTFTSNWPWREETTKKKCREWQLLAPLPRLSRWDRSGLDPWPLTLKMKVQSRFQFHSPKIIKSHLALSSLHFSSFSVLHNNKNLFRISDCGNISHFSNFEFYQRKQIRSQGIFCRIFPNGSAPLQPDIQVDSRGQSVICTYLQTRLQTNRRGWKFEKDFLLSTSKFRYTLHVKAF